MVIGYPAPNPDMNYYKNEYGGRLPIGSMKELRKEKRKRSLLYISRFMFLGGAFGLLVIGVLRFTAVDTPTVHEAILNLYYLFFGCLILLTQLHVHKVVDAFRFLNYYWGKSLFCFFLASLSFSNKMESFLRWILSLYFIACGACFCALSWIDSERDRWQAETDKKLIETAGY